MSNEIQQLENEVKEYKLQVRTHPYYGRSFTKR